MQFSSSKSKFLRTINTSLHHHHSTAVNKRAAEQTCLALLQSCDSLPKLTQLHTHILKLGLHNNPLVLTKFTSTSSDLNSIHYASSLLFASDDADTSLYDAFLFNTVIRAYAQTSSQSKHSALCYYKFMLQSGVLPNKFTYPFVLKACAGLGSLNLGKQVHGSVLKIGFDTDLHVQNTMVHMYCCCGGGLEFARTLFDEMPKPDSVSWSAMIGGYARLGMSINAVGLFREMQISGVRPDEITMVSVLSACTDLGALELGKWLESYIDKAKTHNQYKEIYEMVDEMGREMKRAGYLPTTSEVLLDIDEEDKEDALNRHSEKLAIAFALLKTPPGTPIRIVKNLRVCADCHSATKFISKIYNREIVVRDRNRFHHFSNAICSCKDFW
ncbi:Pentatricopeptide repeat-containing protein [Camellia lanceoleosa]|uniref:Pentatricopeptide repeat-containing protein n=1 Tax=Camellia lanceoleosa TaxID=1840588 RepID=A0ACC0FH87_9ERIC|nr:Pentatricopeptide repeat-containing protein [Camellia lanceoleosa]